MGQGLSSTALAGQELPEIARFFLQVLSLMLLSGAPVWLTVARVLEDNLDLLLLTPIPGSGIGSVCCHVPPCAFLC